MYNYIDKDRISRKIANPHFIPFYRRKLEGYGSNEATLVCVNQTKLAISLVYALLEFMTEEEIFDSTTGAKPTQEETTPAVPTKAVKKKSQNSRNTLTSTGRISIILQSGLRTLSLRTASIYGAACEKWKALCTKIKPLWRSLRSLPTNPSDSSFASQN